MTSKQILGILLLIGGVAAVIYGLSIQNSVDYKLASAFGGDTSRVALLMVGGVLAAVIGLLLLIFGGGKESKNESASVVTERRHQNDQVDICLMDDLKLEEITRNSDSYRPEVVEASMRELLIRGKSAGLIPQVRGKDDGQLREIVANPGLYTEELVRAARSVQEERLDLRLEEERRAQQQVRLEREELAQQKRQQRIMAWKRLRPYAYGALVMVMIVAVGTGFFLYQQKQERIATEQRAAEELRVAQQLQAEKERAEMERLADERRIEDEKQRKEQSAQQAELERLNADVNYRNSKGVYRVGDRHQIEGGVVFRIDNTGKHGKVLSSIEKQGVTWDDAVGMTLPTVNDLLVIYNNRDRLNEMLSAAGYMLISTEYGAHYWSDEKYGSASAWTISMYDGAKNSFYRHNYKAYVREVVSF